MGTAESCHSCAWMMSGFLPLTLRYSKQALHCAPCQRPPAPVGCCSHDFFFEGTLKSYIALQEVGA